MRTNASIGRRLLLGDEAQVLKAECTCALFRKQGLKRDRVRIWWHTVGLRGTAARQTGLDQGDDGDAHL